MQRLIGKVIVKLEISENNLLLRFTDSEGVEYIYATEGDCCSETWWADIIFSRYNMLKDGYPVTKVESIEVPDFVNALASKDGRCRQEYDQVYGETITLQHYRTIDIIYRNSSNGYYGGSYEFLSEDCNSYLGSYLKEELEGNWTSITEDWSA